MAGTVGIALAMGAVAAATILAACGGSGEPTSYTPQVRENFVSSCVDSATDTNASAPAAEAEAERVCGCMYDELSARMSFEEFKAADESLREGGQISPELGSTLRAAASNCASGG